MPTYQYQAMNAAGKNIKGEMLAENDIDLESRLKNNDLDLIRFSVAKKKKGGLFARVKTNDLIVLCMHMEQLSRAGVPLLEALEDVRDSTSSPKMRDVMGDIYETVKNGALLSEALEKHQSVFDKIFIGLITAGEKTGDMTQVYTHLADHYKWSGEIKQKIKKARTYPIFLLLVMGGVISVLMLFVVPQLIDFILSQGFEIPIHTRALIAASEVFVEYWYIIFAVPVLLYAAFKIGYRKSEPFAATVDSIALRLPIFGGVIRKINLARFTHFFSIMFRSGIDILESLESARGVVNNRRIKQSILDVKRQVSEGTSITKALEQSGEFPTMVVRMFKVGESSGNMTEALKTVNYFYNREVNDAVESLVGMIQPALTIVMGTLIFWVISAIFGPLYESFSQMPF